MELPSGNSKSSEESGLFILAATPHAMHKYDNESDAAKNDIFFFRVFDEDCVWRPTLADFRSPTFRPDSLAAAFLQIVAFFIFSFFFAFLCHLLPHHSQHSVRPLQHLVARERETLREEKS